MRVLNFNEHIVIINIKLRHTKNDSERRRFVIILSANILLRILHDICPDIIITNFYSYSNKTLHCLR